MTAFLPQEIIRAKRDGEDLSDDHIAAFVAGISDGTISEGRVFSHDLRSVKRCSVDNVDYVCMRLR